MKLDILALAAHPDDVELSCAGILLAHAAQGYKTGIVDFTRGELGTRGTPELRLQEAAAAGRILGVSVRDNAGFADGFFVNDQAHQRALIRYIRRYRPEIVLANAPSDRHPDHGRAAQLAIDTCFLSGLKAIETEWEGEKQEAWRPKRLYHYIQSNYLAPTFVVDVSPYWKKKQEAIFAFKSQFHVPGDPNAQVGAQTFISSPEFMRFVEARAREWGQAIGVEYAEGLIAPQMLGTSNLFAII